jgi:hypothetical protein
MLLAAGALLLGCGGAAPAPRSVPAHKPLPDYLVADAPLDLDAAARGITLAGAAIDDAAAPLAAQRDGASCSRDGWCWESPSPAREHLRAVWAERSDRVFAVGDHGTVVRYDGHNWLREATPSQAQLVGIVPSRTGLSALGSRGELLQRDAHGWRRGPGPREAAGDGRRVSVRAVWGGSQKAVTVGDGGNSWLHDGVRWRELTTGTGANLRHVAGFSPRRVFAVGDDGVVLRFDGARWHRWPSPSREPLQRVWVDGKLVIAASATRSFLHDGERWHDAPPPGLLGCWRHTRVIYCVSPESTWVLVRDRWTEYSAGTLTRGLNGLHSPDGRRAFAVGERGSIHHYDGRRWSSQSGGHHGHLRAIWGHSADEGSADEGAADEVWAVGDSGAILRRRDGSWSFAADLPTVHSLRSVWGSSSDDVYAVGDAGSMAHFDGNAWRTVRVPTSLNLNAVWGRGHDDVYVAADRGHYLHFDGRRWSLTRLPSHDQPLMAAGTGPRGVWLLALAGGGWHSGDVHSGDVHTGGALDTGGAMVGPHGALVRDAWLGGDGRGFTAGVPVLGFDGEHWLREAVAANDSESVWGFDDGQAYLVGAGGSIHKRDNEGRWALHDSGTRRALHGVWGASADEVFVVGDDGAILRRRSTPTATTTAARPPATEPIAAASP